MPEIKVLPKYVSELIAAGEVVERPSSIVKEIMENSIDAGAKSVTLEIKRGGITYIRLTDDGCGISKNDAQTAFLSHATSKLYDEKGLEAISTLGFRGEALASIAAVSRVEMLTRARGDSSGTRYVIEGGEEKYFDEAGCPEGTTLVIRDIFYNTPARMKFLKKDVSEGNSVAAVADRIALSHPGISVRFIRDGKQVLLTPGDGELMSAIYSVLGREFSRSLIKADYELNCVKISGYIGKPLAARANRNMQYFFINGRLVKSQTACAALEQAYKTNIMTGKFPSCVLNIEIPPETVDVNVHPAKTQVRFSDEKRVFDGIYYAVKNALESDREYYEITADKPKTVEMKRPEAPKQMNFGQSIFQGGFYSGSEDFWQKKTALEFKEGLADENTSVLVVCDGSAPLFDNEPSSLTLSGISESEKSFSDNNTLIYEPPSCAENTEITQNKGNTGNIHNADFKLVGQAFDTYIIIEKEGKLLFIDKHAAHERIIYERLKKTGRIESQLLLCPATVSLSKEEYAAVIDNLDAFERLGFDVGDFGDGTLIIRECPSELSQSEAQAAVTEMAGELLKNRTDITPDKLDRLFQSVACRSAIKAGDKTAPLENERLVSEVLRDENIRYCPHGRPIIVTMTRREIEKQFKRI